MQGFKIYQEKLFNNFQLSNRVPEDNFYRQLKVALDLNFLYDQTRSYYGGSGQKSIDPVVFFKLCLVGYLENIISDRKLINHCSMRLDILYFLDYDIDEILPWHSTISRTRKLFPEAVFKSVFVHVFKLCVEKGMVSGHTQAIDSAPVKANASMDSLELKVPVQDLASHLAEIRHISKGDQETFRKAKENKASIEQQTVIANPQELKAIKARHKKWQQDQNYRVGAKSKNSKYTSNKTHYSPTDPDARISVKPGKARKLNYHSQLTVDSAHHVISDIHAYHACGKDSQHLESIVLRVQKRLWNHGFLWQNCVADTGYSSGENYAFLEQQRLTSYIPPHGTYKGCPEGFRYDIKADHYSCPQGKIIPFKKVFLEHRTKTKKKEYRGSTKLCFDCPLKKSCLKTAKEKRITVTYYREEYERNNTRVKSKRGSKMKGIRQSTVEPVFGTLTQFLGLRKINTIGIQQANKVMHLSACAYNLKKYLKFIQKRTKSEAKEKVLYFLIRNGFINFIQVFLRPVYFGLKHYIFKNRLA